MFGVCVAKTNALIAYLPGSLHVFCYNSQQHAPCCRIAMAEEWQRGLAKEADRLLTLHEREADAKRKEEYWEQYKAINQQRFGTAGARFLRSSMGFHMRRVALPARSVQPLLPLPRPPVHLRFCRH